MYEKNKANYTYNPCRYQAILDENVLQSVLEVKLKRDKFLPQVVLITWKKWKQSDKTQRNNKGAQYKRPWLVLYCLQPLHAASYITWLCWLCSIYWLRTSSWCWRGGISGKLFQTHRLILNHGAFSVIQGRSFAFTHTHTHPEMIRHEFYPPSSFSKNVFQCLLRLILLRLSSRDELTAAPCVRTNDQLVCLRSPLIKFICFYVFVLGTCTLH